MAFYKLGWQQYAQQCHVFVMLRSCRLTQDEGKYPVIVTLEQAG